ncbi:GNAT family toxin-antitoxin system, toxin component [Sporormia fimetaria CBS 119925]|uniref:GNAT family toxin-antitoxin system, toxin component n=1 Tax=Sporormia fimetaria CBS 119925 TaxID=1340428 RepID=A0A6A6VIM7_9PLEO|nr:GNAT family toxin-antitoxin system, toxin component [Sporormia fimetaria CBS 119925]
MDTKGIEQIEVGPATSADLPSIAEIFTHYVVNSVITFEETAPSVPFWQQRLDSLSSSGLPFLVAKTTKDGANEVVGYAYASPWRNKPAYRYTVEDTVYLAPGWTGRGVGSALLKRLLKECQRAGKRQVIAVMSDTGSNASAALHRRFGFKDAGRLTGVGYKHGTWVDTVLMQRELPAERLTETSNNTVPTSGIRG